MVGERSVVAAMLPAVSDEQAKTVRLTTYSGFARDSFPASILRTVLWKSARARSRAHRTGSQPGPQHRPILRREGVDSGLDPLEGPPDVSPASVLRLRLRNQAEGKKPPLLLDIGVQFAAK